ncbi:hypothetical protein AGMMS50267_10430 [Spirochaetia bacterium]|nr:hypothetical protein AGMMS50267_10430 [Spirochaetia bacterium]
MKNFFKPGFFKAFGVIAIVAIIGFSLAGCDDGKTDEPEVTTVTFTLANVDATGFTITVEGADWVTDSYRNALGMLDFDALVDANTNPVFSPYFDCTLSGKVITVTPKLSVPTPLSGTLKFRSDAYGLNSISYDGDSSHYTCVYKPEAGITF